MVEPGLGDALSDQTRLTGEWGNPLSRLAQQDIAMQFHQDQLEAKKLAKEQAEIEKLSKFITKDNSKWYNPKNGEEYGKIYQKATLGLIKNKDNPLAQSEIAQWEKGERDKLLAKDADEQMFSKAKNPYIKQIYSSKGVKGIEEHDAKYPFAAVLTENPETGRRTLIETTDPKLEKVFGGGIDRLASITPELKKVGMVGLSPVYEVDKTSKNYQEGKIGIISEVLENPEAVRGVVGSSEFKTFFDEKLKEAGQDHTSAKPEEKIAFAEQILPEYLLSKFDSFEKSHGKIRFSGTPPKNTNIEVNSGSGFEVGKHTYTHTKNKDGYEVGTTTIGDARPIFTGIKVTEAGDEEANKPYSPNIISPVIHMNPDGDTFTVSGTENINRNGRRITKEIVMKVPKSNIQSVLGLTDDQLRRKFNWKPKVASKAAKMTLPQWRAKNPNASISEYKVYLKS